jgi:hypothetical protein
VGPRPRDRLSQYRPARVDVGHGIPGGRHNRLDPHPT